MSSAIAVDPLEIETRRRERERRLAAFELPVVRLSGSLLLSIAIYLHNTYLVPRPAIEWLTATIALALYAAVSWIAIVYFIQRPRSIDLTVAALACDLVVWTFA